MKKALSLMLALMLVLALSVPVFAETGGFNDTGTITVSNAINGATYSVYRVFDLESFEDSDTGTSNSGHYAYKVRTGDWAGFVNFQANIDTDDDVEKFTDYFTVENGYVTAKPNVDSMEIGLLAMAYVDSLKSAKQPISPEETLKANATTVVFGEGETKLNLGYYLVESDIGILVALSTTNKNATVTEKNIIPTPKKEVQEDDTGTSGTAWGELDTADMYQTINYRTTITLGNGSENIVLHDAMTPGLELMYHDSDKTQPILEVKYLTGGSEATVDSANYAFKANVDHKSEDNKDICDFELHFENNFIRRLAKPATLIVYYSAQLNDQAVQFSERTSENGNYNTTYIEYGNNFYSTEDSTETRTYELKLYKVDGKTNTGLEGASFELHRTIDNKKYVAKLHHLVTGDDGIAVYDIHDWLLYNETGAYGEMAEGYGVTVTSPANGKINIQGLDLGSYQLVETAAPEGYNMLASPINVVMSVDGDNFILTGDSKPTENGFLNIQNNSGTLLPSTGGVGTTMFYIIGGVLAVGAVVLLVTKKRMSSEG